MKMRDNNLHQEIVELCLKIMSDDDTDEMRFIEACRNMAHLVRKYDPMLESCLLPFIGITSELLGYPDKEQRQHYSEAYLKKLDKEASTYLHEARPVVVEACYQFVFGDSSMSGDH